MYLASSKNARLRANEIEIALVNIKRVLKNVIRLKGKGYLSITKSKI